MNKYKFKVGDRIKVVGGLDGWTHLNKKTGTIRKIADYVVSTPYGIELDEPFKNGHDCDGSGKKGHCRWGEESEIMLLLSDWDE